MIQQLKIIYISRLLFYTRFKLEKSLFNGERGDVGLSFVLMNEHINHHDVAP